MTDTAVELVKGKHILVVEDEYLVAADLSDTLQEMGATVIGPFSSVQEALTAVTSVEQLDAATLDVTLGQEKSFGVAEALQKRGVPFVLLTGYDDGSLPETLRDVPRCDKPFDVSKLVNALFG
ncbi:response regulator [Phaeobacter sp. SYSU ZJ3003]|uniref:response regulator n=1 Tax=Phaeobacter sp. SYSU ZJ3003 TaxID=2109330 RepID=UPI00351C3F5F